MHLNLNDTVSGAGFAAPALFVKAETSLVVSSRFGVLGHGKQLPDVVEHSGIGCRIGAGRPSDRRLVDIDDLI